MKPMPDVL